MPLTTSGLDVPRHGEIFSKLMTEVLGYSRYVVAGDLSSLAEQDKLKSVDQSSQPAAVRRVKVSGRRSSVCIATLGM
jgi:hypothetical protein